MYLRMALLSDFQSLQSLSYWWNWSNNAYQAPTPSLTCKPISNVEINNPSLMETCTKVQCTNHNWLNEEHTQSPQNQCSDTIQSHQLFQKLVVKNGSTMYIKCQQLSTHSLCRIGQPWKQLYEEWSSYNFTDSKKAYYHKRLNLSALTVMLWERVNQNQN